MSTNCQSQPPSPYASDHEPQASPYCSFLTGDCSLIVASSLVGRIEGEGGRRGEKGAAMGRGRRVLWSPAHRVIMIDYRRCDILMSKKMEVLGYSGWAVKLWRLVDNVELFADRNQPSGATNQWQANHSEADLQLAKHSYSVCHLSILLTDGRSGLTMFRDK